MPVRATRPGPRRRAPSALAPQQALLLDAVPLPLAVLDAQGRILHVNPAWHAAARPGGLMAPEDDVGTDLLHELHSGKGFAHDAAQDLEAAVKAVLAGRHQQMRIPYRVGQMEDQEDRVAVVQALQSTGEARVLVAHLDETDRKRVDRLAERLVAMGTEVEARRARDEHRRRLLENAVQEIHSPLTPLRIQLHLLRSGALGPLTKRQEKALDRSLGSLQRWWGMVEGLLGDLEGNAPSEGTRFDLRDAVKEAAAPFHVRAHVDGIRFRVDVDPARAVVVADKAGVVQAIMLLLDHAFQVSPAGAEVRLRLRRRRDHFEVGIQDADPGMDPEHAEQLMADPRGVPEEVDRLRLGLRYVVGAIGRNGGTVQTACEGAGSGLWVGLSFPAA